MLTAFFESFELTDLPQLHHLPGIIAQPVNERDIVMARQFFEDNSQGPSAGSQFAIPHRLLPAEMSRIGEINRSARPDTNEAWAREHKLHQPAEDGKAQAAWAAEFGNIPIQPFPGSSMLQDISTRPDCE
jgi:hypothetical protein